MAATTACAARTRSPGETSISRPRLPPLQNTVANSSAAESMTTGVAGVPRPATSVTSAHQGRSVGLEPANVLQAAARLHVLFRLPVPRRCEQSSKLADRGNSALIIVGARDHVER
jgi:hypothetical protein